MRCRTLERRIRAEVFWARNPNREKPAGGRGLRRNLDSNLTHGEWGTLGAKAIPVFGSTTRASCVPAATYSSSFRAISALALLLTGSRRSKSARVVASNTTTFGGASTSNVTLSDAPSGNDTRRKLMAGLNC